MLNDLHIKYLYDGLNGMTLAHSGVVLTAIFGRREKSFPLRRLGVVGNKGFRLLSLYFILLRNVSAIVT